MVAATTPTASRTDKKMKTREASSCAEQRMTVMHWNKSFPISFKNATSMNEDPEAAEKRRKAATAARKRRRKITSFRRHNNNARSLVGY